MKKFVYVAAAGLLALATTACQSSGEKMCSKTHDCAYQLCDVVGVAVDSCKTIADKAEESCMDAAAKADEERKELDSDCADASEAYASCLVNGFSCKDGVPSYDEKNCESKAKKMEEKCTKK